MNYAEEVLAINWVAVKAPPKAPSETVVEEGPQTILRVKTSLPPTATQAVLTESNTVTLSLKE